jgi:Tfp pilus assembly protein FimT
MFVAATVAIVAAAAVPQLTVGVERARAASAARYLAGRLAFARSLAVARSANVALLITADGGAFTSALYVDGNGNGVRTRDVGAGIDSVVGQPVRLADVFPRVVLSLNDPAETLAADTSALISFSPNGTASSRTLYLRGRDGSRYAVRVLGATGRTRVLRWVASTRTWTEVL